MRTDAALLTASLAGALTLFPACAGAGSGGGEVSADCAQLMRFEDVVYVGFGTTGRDVSEEVGEGALSDCDDMGQDPQGAFFPTEPDKVPLVALEGYEPAEVIGVRADDGTVTIYVAESVPDEDRDAILEELG
ncbi:DUF6281 family protein [Nocardioides psychrotolerans]|uniref:DUF6281 family protein n=1 Tax=Nocardioides psychrotolerans TaxID=1005945 RepID=UPI003137DF6A